MAVENIRGAIEAILFANGASVEFSRIAQALEISEKKVKEHISALIDDYEASGRGITIILLDNSCQMVSKKEFAPQIRTVMDLRRNTPLSQAALEVLAVVAYNQPVTKAFVEQVRGVDCSGVIGSLTTKGLVEEKEYVHMIEEQEAPRPLPLGKILRPGRRDLCAGQVQTVYPAASTV